jgi:hypothetical protein
MKKLLSAVLFATAFTSLAGEPVITETSPAEVLPIRSSNIFKRKMQANVDGKSNIVIKMNLSQLAFKNLSFQAEYAFHHKLSFALGFSNLLRRPFPAAFYEATAFFSRPTYGGYAITPELRFYPGGDEDKPAPRGFYLAPYLRYAKYKVLQTVSYQDRPNDPTYTAEAEQTYSGFNGGLMIGYQWIISDHFAIDLWIIGGGYGKAKYTYKWTVPGLSMTPAQQADVKQAAENEFDSFSLFGLSGEVTTTPNSAMMTVRGLPMYSLRVLGLNLGYAF